jgi:hypothetical protein
MFTWSGLGLDNHWTNPDNWTGPVAHVAPTGDGTEDLVFPPGAKQLRNLNDLPVTVTPAVPPPLIPQYTTSPLFHSITFTGENYNISGNAIALSGEIDATNKTGTNTLAVNITFPLDLQNPDPTKPTITFAVDHPQATLILGGIIDGGKIGTLGEPVKDGMGKLVFTGPDGATMDHWYRGQTEVFKGTLNIQKARALGCD